jgi:hypothetical protein
MGYVPGIPNQAHSLHPMKAFMTEPARVGDRVVTPRNSHHAFPYGQLEQTDLDDQLEGTLSLTSSKSHMFYNATHPRILSWGHMHRHVQFLKDNTSGNTLPQRPQYLIINTSEAACNCLGKLRSRNAVISVRASPMASKVAPGPQRWLVR